MRDEVYEILTSPRKTKLKIAAKLDIIRDLKMWLLPSGISYEADRVQTSPDDRLSVAFARIDALEREVAELKDQYAEQQQRQTDAIDLLEDERERLIMIERYVSLKPYEQIAEDMSLSIDRVYQLHRMACKKMGEKL